MIFFFKCSLREILHNSKETNPLNTLFILFIWQQIFIKITREKHAFLSQIDLETFSFYPNSQKTNKVAWSYPTNSMAQR